ncbi:hypothetical protein LUD75_11050 [Epilithonimonas sp. JDS]|uniref:hypothetical protein n=1 Tax=Epilithonimonas sp. JDS TaxID=2902797 RepID=UPI001E3C68B0|nr:hypothetical protein [Epilithonimonas sp. JDS]MCD9855248.1 hypothetical protein [Epilithonimonas sp. JDS]
MSETQIAININIKKLMKNILSLTLIILALGSSKLFSQTDKNGNPIFNSLNIEKIKFENVEIVSNYYSMKDNIDNKMSSVFISENPTSEDYINFATKLPSYYFLIADKGNVIGMAMLIPKTEDGSFFYNFVIPSTKSNFQIASQLKGKITEHRAKEILNIEKDRAKIDKTKFIYNNNDFEIIQYKDIITELENIVLDKINNNQQLESDNVEAYIITESKKGGKLDFTDTVEKYDGAFVSFADILYNKKDFAILLWGASVSREGLKDYDKARMLWEKINSRKLTEPELKALKKGFETKFE